MLEAASGAEAFHLAASPGSAIDLLLTDIIMPGLLGHQLAEQLRSTWPDLNVLYVSGFTENSVIHQGVVGDGINFLPKPYTAEALNMAVRRAIEGRP